MPTHSAIGNPSSEDPSPGTANLILELMVYDENGYALHTDLPIQDLLQHISKGHVNWINLDGLYDPSTLDQLGKHFNLHPLLLEDITSEHLPKVEEYDEYLFVTLKMLYRINHDTIDYEQISFVLGHDFLISFQEKEGDLFDQFRNRIRLSQGRVRKKKADYLMYRLIDIIVDNYYVVLDAIGDQIEQVENDIHQNPTGKEFQKIQNIKKELIFLRKALHPLRDEISKLIKNESEFIDPDNLRFFSDVQDHLLQIIYSIDTYKDLTTGLMDIHINTLNTRLNEVMKVLAVISTIFMPLTFIVGIYGMNFENMPELKWVWGYPLVMAGMALLIFGMIWYFKYKKWF